MNLLVSLVKDLNTIVNQLEHILPNVFVLHQIVLLVLVKIIFADHLEHGVQIKQILIVMQLFLLFAHLKDFVLIHSVTQLGLLDLQQTHVVSTLQTELVMITMFVPLILAVIQLDVSTLQFLFQ
jgi:hypothetical protein